MCVTRSSALCDGYRLHNVDHRDEFLRFGSREDVVVQLEDDSTPQQFYSIASAFTMWQEDVSGKPNSCEPNATAVLCRTRLPD